MKNYIQVNNFRKYISTPEIELNDLNFFVGTNSSGKSSLVKAYMLITTFIKEDKMFEIDFSSVEYKDVNIQDFNRQICQYSLSEENVNIKLCVNNFEYDLTLIPHEKSNFAKVLKYYVTDLVNDIIYEYDFIKNNIVKSVELDDEKGEWFPIEYCNEYVFKIRLINNHKYKDQVTSIIEYLIKVENDIDKIESLNDELRKLENALEFQDYIISGDVEGMITDSLIKESDYLISSRLRNYDLNSKYKKVFKNIENSDISVSSIIPYYRLFNINKKSTSIGTVSLFEENNCDLKDGMELSTKKDRLIKGVKSFDSSFLPLTLKKYTNLNSIVDQSNDLAQLIHNYNNLNSETLDRRHSFIKSWMAKDKFNIGDDFEINFYGGEAYEVLIIENGVKIPLVDKGTGNIQIFKILLLVSISNGIIILEEPELNLHPSLQSKLADLLISVNSKVIVETHSEYLIRRLQVLSIQNKLDRNNLGITYFPTELNQDPYQLRINKDGSLDKNFGSGFFDEAGNHMLELMRFNLTSKN
ncbi:AAA ATPase domain-containing protein [Algoriella xinjiangensis]|uniref:AAA ATPase domain-containing protein n=1 Tax=Algoriella xinjiangensis TaxID=684065 RepID=A0A1I4WV39_9FLAO|nr:AAA family ATPase [Algoriella xinjiangensis]SFN17242.1 AAA ATPase domain-containing protein [Algoriella xinjiangensis]